MGTYFVFPKYRACGYEVMKGVAKCGSFSKAFETETRRVGNHHTWKLQLNTNDIKLKQQFAKETFQPDLLRCNMWELHKFPSYLSLRSTYPCDVRITFCIMESVILQVFIDANGYWNAPFGSSYSRSSS